MAKVFNMVGGGGGKFPTGITITTPPQKTTYKAGEAIDLTGIVITATYSNNTTEDITSQCTFSPAAGTVVYENTTKIDITWQWKNTITYLASQPITVKRTLSSIAVASSPTKTTYKKMQTLDTSGLSIRATFNSGATAIVTGWTTNPANGATLSTLGTVTVTVSYTENGTTKTTTFTITVTPTVYGVEWDGTGTTLWSRTDDAAGFTNPVPYVSGATDYSSPFDNIYPWSGMAKSTRSDAGTVVSIPKYYYKWTRTGSKMKLQICETNIDGTYKVSPAHADRGDGYGERDVVYVGRYHCGSNYKSATGVSPVASITRATARTNIHNLGTKVWQWDYAMLWTIWMLYLVEFANWNSQAAIGYGCGNNSSPETMGYTDSMPYHTGTTKSSRTTYGCGTQYRYIEGLWDNVFDWCDGIRFSGSSVYIINNPSSFSDSSGGTNVSSRPTSSGYISSWSTPTATGLEWALYPSGRSGSDSTYVADFCYYYSSGVVLYVGGCYAQYQDYGLFYLDGYGSASFSSSNFGSRLQVLP